MDVALWTVRELVALRLWRDAVAVATRFHKEIGSGHPSRCSLGSDGCESSEGRSPNCLRSREVVPQSSSTSQKDFDRAG